MMRALAKRGLPRWLANRQIASRMKRGFGPRETQFVRESIPSRWPPSVHTPEGQSRRDATRPEAANDDGAEHGILLRSIIRW